MSAQCQGWVPTVGRGCFAKAQAEVYWGEAVHHRLNAGGLPPSLPRYGKPLVFDMMEVNMFDSIQKQLDRIQAGLTEQLLSKKLLEKERCVGAPLLPLAQKSRTLPALYSAPLP